MILLKTIEFKRLTSEFLEKILLIRRDLHKIPEIGFQEFETSKFIKKYLESLNIPVIENIAITGVIGLLKCGNSDKTIALRADMDALPVTEQTLLDFSSTKKGFMHACGHDIHMSILLGVATVLSELKNELNGNIKFIFQPGEEGYGGAKKMIEMDALNNPKVDRILATHVSPSYKVGHISICKGPAMASPSEFKIIIKGKGGHGAQPQSCINPISVSIIIIDLLHKIVIPNDNPYDNAILTVTSINSGNTHNVIPEEAIILGTVRTFDPSLDYKIFKQIENIVETISTSMSAGYKFFYNVGYPAVINDEESVEDFINSSSKIIDTKNIHTNVKPLMLAEDFAYFLKSTKGAMFNLGCATNDSSKEPGLHNCKFSPNEDCIEIGINLFCQSIVDFLSD